MTEVISYKTFKESLARGREDIAAFAHDFLDIDVHEGQATWLARKEKPKAEEAALACANRWGKTHSAGVKLLHHAFYQVRPDKYRLDAQGNIRPYVAVNIAMSLDQALLASNYARTIAENSKKFKRFIIDYLGTPFPCLTIGNGAIGSKKIVSEIWARSTAKKAKFLLGKSFNFINYDEAAFDADGEYILNGVLRMRLADQAGRIDFTSSPNGRNWFYRLFQQGLSLDNPLFYAQTGSVFDNPHVDHAKIRGSMSFMTEDERRQNVFGQFAEWTNIFGATFVQKCYQDMDYGHRLPIPFGYDILLEDGDGGLECRLVRCSRKPEYVIGVDLARKRDKTCITVLKLNEDAPAELVLFELMARTQWRLIYERLAEVQKLYNNAPMLIDSTGLGDVVLGALQNPPYELNVAGYDFAGGKNKDNLVLHLQAAIQNRQVVFPYNRDLVNSLIYYDWRDKQLSTDALFSLALAWEKTLQFREEDDDAEDFKSPDSGTVFVSYDPLTGDPMLSSDFLDPDEIDVYS